jgi:hypothetical protein
VPFDITIQGARKDTKGGKKRRKQHPQWVVATVGYDDDDKKADDSDKECFTVVGRSVKR